MLFFTPVRDPGPGSGMGNQISSGVLYLLEGLFSFNYIQNYFHQFLQYLNHVDGHCGVQIEFFFNSLTGQSNISLI